MYAKYKISGPSKLLDRLKQLAVSVYNAYLIKKASEYQHNDSRIMSLLQKLERGSIDEQKLAGQQLSQVLEEKSVNQI